MILPKELIEAFHTVKRLRLESTANDYNNDAQELFKRFQDLRRELAVRSLALMIDLKTCTIDALNLLEIEVREQLETCKPLPTSDREERDEARRLALELYEQLEDGTNNTDLLGTGYSEEADQLRKKWFPGEQLSDELKKRRKKRDS